MMKNWDRVTATKPLIISPYVKLQSLNAKKTFSDGRNSIISKISNNGILSENPNKENENKLILSQLFDNMMQNCLTSPPYIVFEHEITKIIKANRAIFWEKHPISNSYIAKTLKSEVPITNSIIQQVIQNGAPIIPTIPYDAEILTLFSINSYDHQFFIPLKYPDGTIPTILQLSRHQNRHAFDKEDFEIADYIIKKFLIYGSSFFQKERIVALASKVTQIAPLSTIMHQIQEVLKSNFGCPNPDIWFFNKKDENIYHYDLEFKEFVGVYKIEAGVVSLAIRETMIVESEHVGELKNYYPPIDGDFDLPVLISSYDFEMQVWCVVLRGERANGAYTKDDQSRLANIIPFISRSLSFSGGFSHDISANSKKPHDMKTKILSLSSLFVKQLHFADLITLIQKKTPILVQCDICRLIFVDSHNQELISDFDSSFQNYKRSSINSGFAGSSAKNGQIDITNDPENDPLFDANVDTPEGIKAASLMSIPIFDLDNNIICVLILLNKMNGEFHERDKVTLMSLAPFIGIAIKNSRVSDSSLHFINNFANCFNDVIQKISINETLQLILHKGKQYIGIINAKLYLNKGETGLFEYAMVGDQLLNTDAQYAEMSLKEIKTITNILNDKNKDMPSQSTELLGLLKILNFVSCAPVLSSNNQTILGVLQIEGSIKDSVVIPLIDSFIFQASFLFDTKEMSEIIGIENKKEKLLTIIDKQQINEYLTPPNLIFNIEEGMLFNAAFLLQESTDEDLIKIVFACFDYFHLKEEYKITNQKLYSFLTNLSKDYNDVPFHNWRHAVSACHFCVTLLITGKYESIFRKDEILSLLLAALGSDCGHDDFLTQKTDTEKQMNSILFSKQSAYEIQHCKELINVLSKESCNILSFFDESSLNSVWNLIIYLILQTDMSKHVDLIEDFGNWRTQEKFSLDIKEHRNLLLALLLKCSVYSDVVKNFEYADSIKEYLGEEFYHQGNLHAVLGMKYLDEDHLRSQLDKPGSFIGFIQYVIHPLFEVLYYSNDDLKYLDTLLTDNFNKWKINDEKRIEIENQQKEEQNQRQIENFGK